MGILAVKKMVRADLLLWRRCFACFVAACVVSVTKISLYLSLLISLILRAS